MPKRKFCGTASFPVVKIKMTEKDILAFAQEHWNVDGFHKTVSDLSRNEKGIPLVRDETVMICFDAVKDSFYPGKGNRPESADALFFPQEDGHEAVLIEFKSGFRQKITRDNFDTEKARCEHLREGNGICHSYWNLFWDNQKKQVSELRKR